MAIPVMNGAIGSRGYLEYSQAHDAEEVGAFPKRMIVINVFVEGGLSYSILVGALEHEFCFSIYWEFHHPNWLSYFSEA